MPTPYSPNGSPMSTPLPLLKDGEVANENDLMDDIIKPIINGVGYCQNAIGTGTIVRLFDIDWYPASGFAATTTSPDWIQFNDAGTGGIMRGRIRTLPNAATVTQIRIWIQPGTHVALPTKPFVVMDYYVMAAGGSAIGPIATLTDPSATFGLYNQYHPLVASGLSIVVNTSANVYLLALTGENAPNEINGLAVFTRAEVTYHY